MEINDIIYVNNFGISKVLDMKDEIVFIAPLFGTSKGTIKMNKSSKNIRNVYSKEEIDEVLEKVNETETRWINKFVERETVYSDIKANPNPFKRLLMIKTIYNHYRYKKEHKIKGGLAIKDLEFYHKSLSLITNEFCLALRMNLEQLKAYISSIWNNNAFNDYFKL